MIAVVSLRSHNEQSRFQPVRFSTLLAPEPDAGYGSPMTSDAENKAGPRRRPSVTDLDNVEQVSSPAERLDGLFAIMEDVTSSADYRAATFSGALHEAARFDLAFLVRGINALKSARLLLEQGHWEFAAGVARQLFDLVVTLEHIAGQPDRSSAAFRYAKFGLLQMVRHERERSEYDTLTGRPVDEDRVNWLDNLLAQSFPEFRKKDRPDGSPRWATSWCDRTTRDLSEASPNPLRPAQYRLLFVTWSEQVHGAPSVMLGSMFRRDNGDWVESVVRSDDLRVSELATMAVTLFLEMWRLLPYAPPSDADDELRWSTDLVHHARRHTGSWSDNER